MNCVFYSYKANSEFGVIDYYESVYANPYTGQAEGMYDEKNNFFSVA